jgi:5'-phosphate synthase pdxT subunit
MWPSTCARWSRQAPAPLAVCRPADIDEVAGLIIPGGKSTTIWKPTETSDLAGPLRRRVAAEP